MMDDMGIFRTALGLESPTNRGSIVTLPNVMVDTGSEYTWVPGPVLERLGIAAERDARFDTADGRAITRRIGYAIVHAESTSAPDIVVFGLEGDMALLGCRALEGLNLRVDVVAKKLVPAGPVPAASTAAPRSRMGTRTRRRAGCRAADDAHASLPESRRTVRRTVDAQTKQSQPTW